MRTIVFFLAITFGLLSVNAQDVRDFNTNNSLSIGIGFSAANILDKRLSNKYIFGLNPKYSISYRQANEKRISQVEVNFVNYKDPGTSLVRFNSIKSNVYYSYERKINDGVWVGGFFDHSTLLTFPINNNNIFVNNTISYTLLQSIGPSVTYAQSFNKLLLTSSAQTSLLSYAVQPIYGHPYPEKFLDERVFNPTQEGLAGPLVRSGKLLTLNKYRSMRVSFGLSYFLSPAISIGLDYTADLFYANANGKSIFFNGQDLMLKASYIH